MKTEKRSEQGQVMVILMIAMIGLLGFTALTIDGGMVYSDRRAAQNAADAASLAGGYEIASSLESGLDKTTYANWSCGGAKLTQAETLARSLGVLQARQNGFEIDDDITDNNGVTTHCYEIDEGSYVDKYADVRVFVTSGADTAFAQFVFGGPISSTVTALTRIRPRTPLAFGYAIMAHRATCPNSNRGGVHFDGSSTVHVDGGGIFSNACMRGNGAIDVNVTGGTVRYVTTYNGNPGITPTPEQEGTPLPSFSIIVPEPKCDSVPNQGSHTGGGTISPGNYSLIRVGGHRTLHLNPGLYCMTGNFRANGSSTVTGDGVTIFFNTGNFRANGSATVQLSAPTFIATPADGLPGMLIFFGSDDSHGYALLKGSATSYYTGTVFGAHRNSRIEVGGSGSLLETFNTQLIAGTVKVHGNATIDINFQDAYNYQKPALLNLEE